MKQSIKVILSGGGTGGHIYPALAIANEIKSRFHNATILFVGAKDRMEMEKVPQAGFDIKGLWISGIQRKITVNNLLFPFKLISSLLKAFSIIKQFKPDVVIGTGGFASGPTLFIAAKNKIPTLIQEQNSFPGITNKLLSKNADKICVAYDNMDRFFPVDKIIKTGNPVRQDLIETEDKKEKAQDFFNLDKSKKILLVLGGSLGARAINQLIEKELHWLVENQNMQIIWQTGKFYFEEYKEYDKYKNVQTYAFLNNMGLAFAAADIIISRAGAGSISELCIVGKPTIFIPSPNVAEDHQTKNALAIVNHNAAIMIKESELERFQVVFGNLNKSKSTQDNLSKNIKALALPNATNVIVNQIEELLKNSVN